MPVIFLQKSDHAHVSPKGDVPIYTELPDAISTLVTKEPNFIPVHRNIVFLVKSLLNATFLQPGFASLQGGSCGPPNEAPELSATTPLGSIKKMYKETEREGARGPAVAEDTR